MTLLAGTGYMAREYAKVLKAMSLPFIVVGRSKESVDAFKKETGIPAADGGIEEWLKINKPPKTAIVAVTEEQLGTVTRQLLKNGVKEILVEKPSGLSKGNIVKTANFAKRSRAKVFIAYNRRFYASTQKAKKLIKKDGGVLFFNFDFTERSHLINKLAKSKEVKKNWVLSNSSHVIDLAFYLGGKPKEINGLVAGKNKIDWHPSGSIFAGYGISKNNVPFSYQANWLSPGRWKVEMFTQNYRLLLQPLENLYIESRDSKISGVKFDDKLDKKFKPGLYKMVESFMSSGKDLPTVQDQILSFNYYKLIGK